MSGWREVAWTALRPRVIAEFRRSAGDGRGDPASAERARAMRIAGVISRAARQIPFYRELWGGQGILASAERGRVGLDQLPLLTRDHLRHNRERLLDPDFDPHALVDRTTGGSSGEPVRFYQTPQYLDAATGRGLRLLTWGGWRLGAPTAMLWGGPNELSVSTSFSGKLKALVTNRRMYDAFRAGTREYDAWLESLRQWRPRFVIGYVSALDGLARHVLAHARPLTGIEAVFSTAERLLPPQRARIEQAFGCSVRDQYGSREVQALASQCTAGRMHAYLDSAAIELLPSPSGLGRVVLTQLDNPAMPLIRYENGDLARWALTSQSCACGLHYPALAELSGRISDLFRFGDQMVHGEYFSHIMYDVEGVEAFQFHQHRDATVTLYVVTSPGVDESMVRPKLEELAHGLPRKLGIPVSIAIEFKDEIPPTPQGKHRFTVSELAS